METNTLSYDSLRERNELTSCGSFMQLLKSNLMLNGGNYLKLTIAILGCFIAVDIIVSIFTIERLNSTDFYEYYYHNTNKIDDHVASSHDSIKSEGMSAILFACFFIISIGSTVIGSLTFSSMSDKRKRISTLMMPASISQKFWLRFLIYTCGGTLLMIIGVLLSYLIAQIAFGGAKFGLVWDVLKTIYETDFIGPRIIPIVIALVLYGYSGLSTYALGSAFWPKLSWLKTWIVLMIAEWVFMIIMMFGAFSDINFDSWIKYVVESGNPDFWIWLAVVLGVLYNAGCWALAYWRFRNTQIVQRFMKK